MNDFSPLAALHQDPELDELLDALGLPLMRSALDLAHAVARDPELANDPRVVEFIHRHLEGAERLVEPEPWELELERLDGLDPLDRLRVVREAPSGEMVSPELARTFGRRAVDALPGDPDASLHWAELCGVVAHRGTTDEHRRWSAHWLVLAGNAERARGRLDAAVEAFRCLELEDEVSPAPEPWMGSERHNFLASWYLERGEFGPALQAASRSSYLANVVGDRQRHGRAALLAGAAYFDLGRFRAAVSAHRVAKRIYDPEEHPLEAMMARHNEALAWCEGNNSHAGRGVLLRNQKLFHRFPEMTRLQLRRRWTEARAAYGVGEFLEAEGLYRRVLEGFLEEEALTEAILVTLDLVLFFLLQFSWDEVVEVGDWALPRLHALATKEGSTPELDVKLEVLERTVEDPRKAPLKALLRATGVPRAYSLMEPPETLL